LDEAREIEERERESTRALKASTWAWNTSTWALQKSTRTLENTSARALLEEWGALEEGKCVYSAV